MSDTAERIFLPRLPAFKENTFCADQADTDTVEYIRADLHQKALDRIEELETKVDRLRVAIATHGAEACGILISYHKEDGTRLWRSLRAAL